MRSPVSQRRLDHRRRRSRSRAESRGSSTRRARQPVATLGDPRSPKGGVPLEQRLGARRRHLAGARTRSAARPATRPGRRRTRSMAPDSGPAVESLREESDEAVVAPARHERELRSVGRPFGALASPVEHERRCGLCPVKRNRPDLVISNVRDRDRRGAIWRANRRPRGASVGRRQCRHAQISTFGWIRLDAWIGRETTLRRPIRVVVAAAHVYDGLAVGREGEIGELLPVVGGVVGHAVRLPVRARGLVECCAHRAHRTPTPHARRWALRRVQTGTGIP